MVAVDLQEYAEEIFARLPGGVSALAYVAGGCFRSQLDGTEVKDIDLFFSSRSDYDLACFFFASDETYQEIPSETVGNRVFSNGVNPPFNLIGFRFHKTLIDLVTDFDLTCVTCGAEMVEPGVVILWWGEDFEFDAVQKIIRFNVLQNYERASRRVHRYESYGYMRSPLLEDQLERCKAIPVPARGGDY